MRPATTDERAQEVQTILQQTRALLGLQKELGLRGLNVPPEILLQVERPSPSQSTAKPPKKPSFAEAMDLESIRADMGDCQRCKLCRGRTTIVFGAGRPDARLMFVGEGPGLDEDLQSMPFVGAAGKLLDRMITAMGLRRADVYVANVVKCRPPRNRDPEPEEVEACEPFLVQQVRVVQPEVLVALGRVAAQTLLRDPTPIARMRGKWREYEGVSTMPTFHPAHLLRNPADKKPAWLDLQAVMSRLGLKDPRRRP